MNVHGQWPNVERVLVAWLSAECGVPVYTETPTDLEKKVPCIVVERVPGGAGRDFEKTFIADVTVFASTRPGVWALVQQAEPAMVRCQGFDEVRENDAFGNVPYSNPALRRAIATYELDARPQ